MRRKGDEREGEGRKMRRGGTITRWLATYPSLFPNSPSITRHFAASTVRRYRENASRIIYANSHSLRFLSLSLVSPPLPLPHSFYLSVSGCLIAISDCHSQERQYPNTMSPRETEGEGGESFRKRLLISLRQVSRYHSPLLIEIPSGYLKWKEIRRIRHRLDHPQPETTLPA